MVDSRFLDAARQRPSEGLFTEYVVDELDAGQTMVSVGPASIVNGMTPPFTALVMASFESPGLNLEQLEGRTGRRRLWTIRASQELRVLLVRDGPTWVFLRAGHHDEIYDLAERRTFVVPVDGHPGLISIRPTPPDSGDSAPDRVAET